MSDGHDSFGFGQHADYVFGWQGTTLQDAMDAGCYLRNCSKLTSQSAATKNKCVVEPSVKEDLDACMVFTFLICAVGLADFNPRARGTSRGRRVGYDVMLTRVCSSSWWKGEVCQETPRYVKCGFYKCLS